MLALIFGPISIDTERAVGELLQDGLRPVGRLLRDRDHKMGLRWTQLIDRDWSIGAARAVILDQLIPSVPKWGWLMSSGPKKEPDRGREEDVRDFSTGLKG